MNTKYVEKTELRIIIIFSSKYDSIISLILWVKADIQIIRAGDKMLEYKYLLSETITIHY